MSTTNNTAEIDPSYYITGFQNPRELAENERAGYSVVYIVGFQRGFEQTQVAVYGDGISEADAEEAAIEFLEKKPNALTVAEIESREAANVFSVPFCTVCGSLSCDALAHQTPMSTEELAETWEEDRDGEYIQLNRDGSASYVANGVVKEHIPAKGDVFKAITEWMDREQYFLNIWSVNDHGNVTLHDAQGKELGGLV